MTLRFKHPRLESHYKKYHFINTLMHARFALFSGAFVYELYGILDYYLLPKEIIKLVTVFRLSTSFTIFMVFVCTFFRFYRKWSEALLALIAIVATVCLLCKIWLMGSVALSYYFAALLLFFFWIHVFQVLSFIHVFIAACVILLSDLIFLKMLALPDKQMVSYTFILITTACLTIFAAYITEKRNRFLFLREKELDRERFDQHERAMHDTLTNLPNRALLFDHISRAIDAARRSEIICAGYFLDLDDFKAINDTYGHPVGDAVLKEVSERLKTVVRSADTVARLSGDEFFIVASDIKSEQQAIALGTKLLHAIQIPYQLQGMTYASTLSVSIGICMFPYQDVSSAEVVARADRAMYMAKSDPMQRIVVA